MILTDQFQSFSSYDSGHDCYEDMAFEAQKCMLRFIKKCIMQCGQINLLDIITFSDDLIADKLINSLSRQYLGCMRYYTV